MSQTLKELLHQEAGRIEIPPAPTGAILAGGRRRRTVRRTQVLLAVAASVALIVGASIGVDRLLLADDPAAPGPAKSPSAPAVSTTPDTTPEVSPDPVGGVLSVDGTGVGTLRFGTPADEVLTALETQLGQPDTVVGPDVYARIPGNTGYFQDGGDNLSPSWKYEFTSVRCWKVLCVIFGGTDIDSLQLRGWELAQYDRWSDGGRIRDLTLPDVRLAGSEVGLGDTWQQLRTAFPGTRVADAEGGSLSVRDTPWTGIFDGVAEWRLKGYADPDRPGYAPDGAKITRLSGGEGPQPGCC